MEAIKKISDREKKLLLIFLSLLILVGAYQLGYQKYTNKTDVLTVANLDMKAKLNVLQEKQRDKEKYLKETKEWNIKTDKMLNEFAVSLPQNKITMFVTSLEEYAGMKVSSISFQDMSIFYTSTQTNNAVDAAAASDATVASDGTATVETTATDQVGEDNDATIGQESLSNLDLTGYQTTTVLTYQTTYDGMKKCIDYINNNEEKMNISDLTVAFDNTTGNLSGTLTINMYALDGINKAYVEPEINGVDIGTDNIFGTFELPLTTGTN